MAMDIARLLFVIKWITEAVGGDSQLGPFVGFGLIHRDGTLEDQCIEGYKLPRELEAVQNTNSEICGSFEDPCYGIFREMPSCWCNSDCIFSFTIDFKRSYEDIKGTSKVIWVKPFKKFDNELNKIYIPLNSTTQETKQVSVILDQRAINNFCFPCCNEAGQCLFGNEAGEGDSFKNCTQTDISSDITGDTCPSKVKAANKIALKAKWLKHNCGTYVVAEAVKLDDISGVCRRHLAMQTSDSQGTCGDSIKDACKSKVRNIQSYECGDCSIVRTQIQGCNRLTTSCNAVDIQLYISHWDNYDDDNLAVDYTVNKEALKRKIDEKCRAACTKDSEIYCNPNAAECDEDYNVTVNSKTANHAVSEKILSFFDSHNIPVNIERCKMCAVE